MPRITVNDEAKEISEGTTLAGLLEELQLGGRKGLAVAVNATVIPAAQREAKALAEGDAVLIIQATQGG
ncbi:MAG: sulfur carrier protein ThiS [Puniceicoccaceae bacterium]|nr:MAG: sulfur carrier protein ThiS [Puniceicoccaceae bacterium]